MTRRPHWAWLLAALVAIGCANPGAGDRCCELSATLSAPTWSRSFFRPVLAMSGDGSTIAVGAERVEFFSVNVFIFRRGRDGWALGETLQALPAVARSRFDEGMLALSDDGRSLAVGVAGQDPRVFDFRDGAWELVSVVGDMEPPVLRAMDGRGGTLVVLSGDERGEVVEVGERVAGWRERQRLASPLESPLGAMTGFGDATALSRDGGVLVVGAPQADVRRGLETRTEAGTVVAFPRSSTGRFDVGFLLDAPAVRAGERFGSVLASNDDGTWIAVGAPEESSSQPADRPRDAGAPRAGAVTAYRFVGDGWVVDEHFKAVDPEPEEAFGSAVALSGDASLMAVGVPMADAGELQRVGRVELFPPRRRRLGPRGPPPCRRAARAWRVRSTGGHGLLRPSARRLRGGRGRRGAPGRGAAGPRLRGPRLRPAGPIVRERSTDRRSGGTPPRVRLVIPCYNEESRLSEDELRALLDDERIRILFVNDGSTDGTLGLLGRLVAELPDGRAALLDLPKNGGKAEAVRQGLRRALAEGATEVGYIDADFATPPSEVRRLVDELHRSDATVVLGSRVSRLGADIDRNMARHYLGRVFATTASMILGLAVYDTQCGAKLFRDTPTLRHALQQPFRSRWAFDVELLGRLVAGGPGAPGITAADMLEVPLRRWADVGGSKLGGNAMVKAGMDLLGLGARVARQGRGAFYRGGEE